MLSTKVQLLGPSAESIADRRGDCIFANTFSRNADVVRIFIIALAVKDHHPKAFSAEYALFKYQMHI